MKANPGLVLSVFAALVVASPASAAPITLEDLDACALAMGELPSVSKKLPDLADSRKFVERRQKERAQTKILEARRQKREELAKACGLDAKEVGQLEDYSAYDYEELNPVLREDAKAGKPSGMNRDYARIELLKAALEKVPAHPGVSFRGANLRQPALEALNLQPGTILDDAAFVSTDLNPLVAMKFAEKSEGWMTAVFFEIHGRTGRNLTAFSSNSAENEILFLPHTRFRVVSVETIGTRKLVKLEEIEAS